MWTTIIIVIVIAFLYYNGRGSKQGNKILSSQKPTYNTHISQEQFDQIISEYKNLLDSPNNDDKKLEQLANEFELKFYLRTQLYDFFYFLEEKFGMAKDFGEGNKWWSSKLLNLKNIHIDGSRYSDFSASITLDEVEVQFTSKRSSHIDEFETHSSPYDPSYYDFDRTIIIKTKSVVYQVAGRDYRVDYRPPKIPEYISVTIFKPSQWLFTVHNFLIGFAQEKSDIESNLEQLKSEHALKRAKDRFAV